MAEPLGQAFTRIAGSHPDRPAVTDDDETVTFAELEARANRWAHHLAGLGVVPGDFVSIALPNAVAHIAVTVATWKLGAVPQPLSHRLPAAETAAILEVVRPAVLVGADPGGPTAARALVADPSTPDGPDTPPPPAPVPPAWKAPTSGGSTGRPKVIVAGEEGTFEAAARRAPLYGIEPGGVLLCTAPLHHNAPYLFSLAALVLGNHIVLMGRFDAARALDLAAHHGVTWFYAVPTMMRRILMLGTGDAAQRSSTTGTGDAAQRSSTMGTGDAAQRSSTMGTGPLPALPALATLFHIGAPCPVAVKRGVIDWLGPDRVLEGYAGTEAQARTTITGREWLEHPGSVGRVVGGEIEIRDPDDDHPCAPGEVGELWLRPDPGVTTYRYLGAEPRARGEGWESLGDMGWFDDDGYLHLADRRSDMIVVGGENVYPAEVEGALLEHPHVVSAVVVRAPDDDLGSVPHGVVQTDGTDVSDAELDAHVAARLARHKRPRAWRRSSEPLRDDAGKVRRSLV